MSETCQYNESCARRAEFGDLCGVHFAGEKTCISCGETFEDTSERADIRRCDDCPLDVSLPKEAKQRSGLQGGRF